VNSGFFISLLRCLQKVVNAINVLPLWGHGHDVYNYSCFYTLEETVGRVVLTRTNLMLEVGKVRRLRKALQSRSNSEAVRLVIDERLAAKVGLQALRNLQRLGGPADVFGRAPAKKA